MDTQTQIDRLIELAIVQRAELKALVEQLPQLREYLGTEIEKTFEQVEPQLRGELEEFCNKRTEEFVEALRGDVSEQVGEILKTLETAAAAKYSALMAERERNAELEKKAEDKIAEAAAALPSQVKEIVTAELARFPRAGEIDQLRKEFAEPKSLNPRGKWVAGETYNKLDLVTINGDSYVSNIDGNTEKPSRSAANWTLNAARGNSGGGGGITALNDLLGNPSAGDIVGSEGNNYVRKTLTAGTGITITDDPSTITIDASGAQEMLTATVKNAESVAITRGQVVYLFSATGGFPSVKLAYNTSDATSAKTFGVVSDVSIAPNGTGTITCVGVVSNLNLGAYNDGDTVYLGDTPGSFTATKPYAPNHLVYVGIIERANAGNGELYVRVQNGYELDEIHDVQINNPRQAGQTLIYDATNALWKNARLTAGVGVSISNGDSAITISADGGVNYQGTWNASTNTPTLTSSVGTKGFYYVVSVAGSTNLNGVTDWKVGDWAIFNGTAWEKVDTTDQVSSVFGRTGAVVGVSTDYSSVGITNTAIGASNPSTGAFTTLSASTSLSGGASGLSIEAGGTNQNITLTPSGTGRVHIAKPAGQDSYIELAGNGNTAGTSSVVIGQSGADLGVLYNRKNAALSFGTNGTEVARFFANGNLFIGASPVDGGQKLQVSGTAFANRYDVLFNDNPTGTSPRIFASASAGSTVDVLVAGAGSRAGNIQYYNDGGGTSQLKFGTSVPSSTTEHVRFSMPTSGLGSSVVSIYGTTASTSTTAGALVVTGGVGVGGAINAGGNLTVSGTGTINGGFTAGTNAGDNFLIKGGNPTIKEYGGGACFLDFGQFGVDTTTNGVLRTMSSGSRVTALTLSGANATLAGNLTVSGTGTSTFSSEIAANKSASNISFAANGSTPKSGIWTNNDGTMEWSDYATGTHGLSVNMTNGATVVSGNLTVSGGTVTGPATGAGLVLSSTLGASGPTSAVYNTTTNTRSTFAILGNGGSSQAVLQFGYGSPSSITNTGNIFTSTSNFDITSSGLISLNAGGTNQNITLTPSGTGNISLSGPVQINGASTNANYRLAVKRATNFQLGVGLQNASSAISLEAFNDSVTANVPFAIYGNPLSLMGGSVLVGTFTNSSNGAIQLATHTTSAGGIGFGTDTPLYRSSQGVLNIEANYNGSTWLRMKNTDTGAGAAAGVLFANQSGDYGAISILSSGATPANALLIRTLSTNSLILRTNGNDALTLDSSQNATFAGTGQQSFNGIIQVAKTAAGANSNLLDLYNKGTTNNTSSGIAFSANNASSAQRTSAEIRGIMTVTTAGSEESELWFSTRGAGVASGTAALKIANTGDATFAGSIAIGNTVNTVSPTSPNRTITMVIGGTTYYIHAKTTND